MAVFHLLYGLPPLIAFVVVRHFSKDVKNAVYAGIVAGFAEFLLRYLLLGEVDYFCLGATAFVVAFGAVSAWKNDPLWFKLQPVAILALVFLAGLYTQFFKGGVVHMFQAQLVELAPEAFRQYFDDPNFIELYELCITLSVVVALPAQGLLLTFAARHWSDEMWLAIRAFGLYPMMFVVAVLGAMFKVVSG
jgi:intracellular septation protein A